MKKHMMQMTEEQFESVLQEFNVTWLPTKRLFQLADADHSGEIDLVFSPLISFALYHAPLMCNIVRYQDEFTSLVFALFYGPDMSRPDSVQRLLESFHCVLCSYSRVLMLIIISAVIFRLFDAKFRLLSLSLIPIHFSLCVSFSLTIVRCCRAFQQ